MRNGSRGVRERGRAGGSPNPLPRHRDGISRDLLVAAHENEVFDLSLRDENPVEWVTVMVGQSQAPRRSRHSGRPRSALPRSTFALSPGASDRRLSTRGTRACRAAASRSEETPELGREGGVEVPLHREQAARASGLPVGRAIRERHEARHGAARLSNHDLLSLTQPDEKLREMGLGFVDVHDSRHAENLD